jgi:hypothetical protein
VPPIELYLEDTTPQSALASSALVIDLAFVNPGFDEFERVNLATNSATQTNFRPEWEELQVCGRCLKSTVEFNSLRAAAENDRSHGASPHYAGTAKSSVISI